MSETILARGTRTGKKVNFKRIMTVAAIVAAVVFLFGLISSISDASTFVSGHEHSRYCYDYYFSSDYYDALEEGTLDASLLTCDYAKGGFGLGWSWYFDNGGFVLPMLILIGAAISGYVSRARNRGYEIIVTAESVKVVYDNEKAVDLPLCSIFTVEKTAKNGLNIVTSENAYTFNNMDGLDEVYDAIVKAMPTVTLKGPANNEQVLAKGYPPAIKPLLLILCGILVFLAIGFGAAAASFLAFIVGLIPFGIVFIFYLLAKTPYLVVTDKRVFYVTDFGRKLSLPLNQITVTVTHQWFRQLHICAPVGRIHLFWVRNTAELYDIINALLNEKQ